MRKIKSGDYVEMLKVVSDRNYLKKGKIYKVVSIKPCIEYPCNSCANKYSLYVQFISDKKDVGALCDCVYRLITNKKIIRILDKVEF